MATDLKNLREAAVRKAMAESPPQEYDPSSFADAGDLHSDEAGRFGHMLDEARKTPELPEEKPKAQEPEQGRYDLQNRISDEALRAGMEMHGLGPDYLKELRERVGRTYWTDPLAEGGEESGRDGGEAGNRFGGTFGAERIEAVAVGEGWDQEVTDAAHGMREKLQNEDPQDDGGDYEFVEAVGNPPTEFIFEGPDGEQYSVEYSTGEVVGVTPEQRTP